MDSDKDVKGLLEAHIDELDLAREIRKTLFDGFETFEDYVKYGDMFVLVSPQQPVQSSRALVRRRPA